MFTNSLKRAREIRKFQVADLQRRLRNVQKSVCFADINPLFFFAVLVAVSVVVAKALHCCDPEMLLPWQRSVTLLLSIESKIN